jgi:KDO2-lipid IV(A) lauroyltransferase
MASAGDIPKILFLFTARHIIPYLPSRVKHVLAELLAILTTRGEKAAGMDAELEALFGPERLPAGQRRKVVREAVANFRKDLFEIWSFRRLTPRTIGQLCYPDGIENLDRALEKGRGAIIVLCHFGSYKMILPCLGHRGYKITQIAANPLEFGRESFMKYKVMAIELEAEKSLPADFIYIGGSVREIYRVLERNEILVVSLDGVMDPRRVTLPFFRKKIRLAPAGAKIARKFNTPLLPVFTVRGRDGRHRVIIHEELAVNWEDPDAERQVLEKFLALMERHVGEHPEHYAWFLYKNRTDPPKIGPIVTN